MIRNFAVCLAALSLIAVATPSSAAQRGWFPRKAGECGWVYGRYKVYNGSGIRRIWVIGTSHILNLYDDDPTDLPQLRYANMGPPHFGRAVFGDYFVCARERLRKGHMQHIWLRRTKNLVVV